MSDWIDLTQTLGPDCPTQPPNRPAPEFESYANVEEDGYNGTRLYLDTHMDAPTHFLPAEEARTIDDVTPDEMVTEGVVLDFTDHAPGTKIERETMESEADRRELRAATSSSSTAATRPVRPRSTSTPRRTPPSTSSNAASPAWR